MTEACDSGQKPSDSILSPLGLTLGGGWELGDMQRVLIAMLRREDERHAPPVRPMTKQDLRLKQIWRNKTTGLEQEVIGLTIIGTPKDTVALRTRDGVCSGMSADALVETHVCRVMGWSEPVAHCGSVNS